MSFKEQNTRTKKKHNNIEKKFKLNCPQLKIACYKILYISFTVPKQKPIVVIKKKNYAIKAYQ